MALTPITKRLVPDDVFEQLMTEVVDGSLSPGDALPSERRLAELLGVSRPAVREALQRLSATRLVEVRHGGATVVRDLQRHAGLDLLPRLLVRDGELDPTVARSIVEARLSIAPDVARMAAERADRASETARDGLLSAQQTLAEAEDPVARQYAALAFWDAVVDCADSIVFRLMFNNLRQAYEPAIEPLAPLLDGEVSNVEGYRDVSAAVLACDGPAASAAADALLRPATEAMVGFLDAFQDEPDEGEAR
ncbi:FadR family transcriptional regulator [Nocardioides marmoriginsengisoli]|uniref:FadR family transcriptional regulator n=1 Tax=Nocardioides marmoriginsengisoli TaxID=661483 RepID=A0A3N0CLD3_9ACTN|nr:GntR family transcriptional regulator [Nocardioides marmoriginsengisoli]RNL64258.1 FadR family transcriptional regulator [Nocardioides marmoriginsengisoli]